MSDRIPDAVPSPARIVTVNVISAIISLPLLVPLAWLLNALLRSPRAITDSPMGMGFAYLLLVPSVMLVGALGVAWIGQRVCARIGMRQLPLALGTFSLAVAGLIGFIITLAIGTTTGLMIGAVIILALALLIQQRIYQTGGIRPATVTPQGGNTFRITPEETARAAAAQAVQAPASPMPATHAPATAAAAAQLCVQLVQSWRALEAVATAQMPASGEGLLSAEVHAGSQRLGALGADGIRLSQQLQASTDVNERYAADLLSRLAGAATALGAVARWEEWRVAGAALTRLTDAMTESEPIRDWVRRMYATVSTPAAA